MTTTEQHLHATRVEPTELKSWLTDERPPRIIDVRTPGEFDSVHIPGSFNVPLPLLQEHVSDLREHLDRHVVLICRSGSRASEAESALAEAGLDNLHVLDGGMDAWQAHGAPVRHSDHAWDLERQVRLVAGSLALSGVLLSTVAPKAKWLSAAMGAGLLTAALTDSCMMAKVLSKLPFNRGTRGDLDEVLAQLRG